MQRASLARSLRIFHQQRRMTSSGARMAELYSPAPNALWSSLRYALYLTQGGLLVHFLFMHVGFFHATFGPSMVPTLGVTGDCVLISKLHKKGKGVKVGDVVDFSHPLVPATNAIKRIAALPGDFIVWDHPAGDGEFTLRADGTVIKSKDGGINMWADQAERRMLQIPEGHFWALGDNQTESRDSRVYGPVPLGLIKGKVIAKTWPLGEAKWLENNVQPVSGEL